MLEGDAQIKDLLAISYYDSKLCYFLSTVINKINWVTCGKGVYSKFLKRKVTKQFLRPNFVNIYNFDMNSVDRADHLRKNYCFGEDLRQRKWWFSIFLWGLDVSMVNAYLLYKSWMEMHKLSPMSHYRFRERIAEAWMDLDNYWKERYPKRRKLVSQASVCLSGKSIKQLSTGSISSLSRQTRSTAASAAITPRKNCRQLSQTALDSGRFASRLLHSGDCTHLPTPVHSKHSECQLHKWASKRTRKQVMTCSDCDITLCVQYYKPFHTVLNLNCIKADIENDQDITVKSYPLSSHPNTIGVDMKNIRRI